MSGILRVEPRTAGTVTRVIRGAAEELDSVTGRRAEVTAARSRVVDKPLAESDDPCDGDRWISSWGSAFPRTAEAAQ